MRVARARLQSLEMHQAFETCQFLLNTAHQGPSDALRELLLDASRCEAMGRRGRDLAVAEFSVEHVVEATLRVYAGLEAQPSHDLPRGHRVQS